MNYRKLRDLLMLMTDEQLDCTVVYFARTQAGEEIHAVNSLAPLVGLRHDRSSPGVLESPYHYALTSPPLRGRHTAPRRWTLEELIDAFGEPTGGGTAPVAVTRTSESIELRPVPLESPISDPREATWLAWSCAECLRIAMRPTTRDTWTLIIDQSAG